MLLLKGQAMCWNYFLARCSNFLLTARQPFNDNKKIIRHNYKAQHADVSHVQLRHFFLPVLFIEVLENITN